MDRAERWPGLLTTSRRAIALYFAPAVLVARVVRAFMIAATKTSDIRAIEGEVVQALVRPRAPVLGGAIKRLGDVVLSLLLILWVAPLFPIISLVILVSQPGPVMLAYQYVGAGGKRFRRYKFRTIATSAVATEHVVGVTKFRIVNDPVLTPVGRVLRRYSLDELPELINVLRGDMSLVGPRPLPVQLWEAAPESVKRTLGSVRPGIIQSPREVAMWFSVRPPEMAVGGPPPETEAVLRRAIEATEDYMRSWSISNDIIAQVQAFKRLVRAVIRREAAHSPF